MNSGILQELYQLFRNACFKKLFPMAASNLFSYCHSLLLRSLSFLSLFCHFYIIIIIVIIREFILISYLLQACRNLMTIKPFYCQTWPVVWYLITVINWIILKWQIWFSCSFIDWCNIPSSFYLLRKS